jgi:hypothetical protein
MPKCNGSKEHMADGTLKCEVCGKSYLTKRGLSQHERHQHAATRNEKRAAGTGKGAARPKPKGYGQVWSKEEIDLMSRLEIDLTGGRNIASKMCQHLPGKSYKQIRDKRAEATYKRMNEETLSARTRSAAEEGKTEGYASATKSDNREKPPNIRRLTNTETGRVARHTEDHNE